MLTASTGRSGAPAGWSREDLPLAAAVAVEVLVVVLLPRVVTVDGPAHVLGGAVLAQHLPGGADPTDLVRRFYEVDLQPVPNLLTTVLLAGLLLVLGPDAAEKALVAGHVVLLPLALRYALRGVDPRAGWLAVAALPFTFGYLFSYGFYNFLLAVSLALLVIGLVLRRRTGWSAGSVAGLAALLLVTWSAHLLPTLVAGATVAALAGSRALAARGASTTSAAVRRHVLPVVAAGLPVLVLTLAFAASDAAQRGGPERLPLLDLVLGLVGLGKPLVVHGPLEHVPAVAVAAVLGWLAARAVRTGERTPERRALAAACLVVTAAYVASPQRYGIEYGFLNDRLATFPPLLLLLAVAAVPPSPALRRRGVAALVAAAAALALLRLPTEVHYQRDVAEVLSVAPAVPRGSTLLRVQLWRDPPVGPDARNATRDPLRHEVSRLAVLTGGVDVGHYEADLPYFPVRFRPEVNPRRVVDPTGLGLQLVPPAIDLAAGVPVVDVVVVVGRRQAAPDVLARPDARRVLADLEAAYRQVAVSAPDGLAEVWVRR